MSVAPPAPIRLRPPDSAAETAIDEEHGLDSVAEILGYLVSLVRCLDAWVARSACRRKVWRRGR